MIRYIISDIILPGYAYFAQKHCNTSVSNNFIHADMIDIVRVLCHKVAVGVFLFYFSFVFVFINCTLVLDHCGPFHAMRMNKMAKIYKIIFRNVNI